jgi:hypothetical protein
MNDTDTEALSEGLYYEDRLPMRWQECGELPAPVEILALNRHNEQVLRHLSVIDEIRGEGAEEDGHGHAHANHDGHNTQRLEFKIDVLIDMVAELLGRHLVLPDSAPVHLGADFMQWRGEAPAFLEPGRLLRVEVYLNRKYPSPLVLFGAVESVQPENGGLSLVSLRHQGVSAGLRSGLERIIFRQHRRLIAQARQSTRRSN